VIARLWKRLFPAPAPSPATDRLQESRDAMLEAMARLDQVVTRLKEHRDDLMDGCHPAPEEAPEFTAEDRGALLGFLRSAAGRKVLLTMRCQEELLKKAACDDTEKRVDHARGQAVGYRKGIGTLIVLSAPLPSKEDTASDQPRDADALREELSHG
jgi:hypothetical protein